MNVFSRSGGQIRHFYATEQADPPPEQDDRHVDMIWPLWNLLDLTPAGRGDWRHCLLTGATPASSRWGLRASFWRLVAGRLR